MQVHQETFGKSGCRRIVPGQYLAIEPKGRAVMIGKQTFYLLLLKSRGRLLKIKVYCSEKLFSKCPK